MREALRSTLLAIVVVFTGCGSSSFFGSPGGATPGGAQDVGYARTIIASGGVPGEGTYSAEGLYAEHDLPLPGDAVCARALCVRGAGAAARFLDDGASDALIQFGFSSAIDPATFHRRPLNLTLVVDVSCSMEATLPAGGDAAGGGRKINLVSEALQRLVRRLGADDRLGVVLFNDEAHVVRQSAPVKDAAAVQDLLRRVIQASGGTSIEAGLNAAFAEVRKMAGEPGVLDRVMLFTDAQPNVGATDPASFRGLIGRAAEEGIGFSAFGVGLDFGNALAYEIAHLRGGNYFYLSDRARIRQILDEEFDLVVTPIAFDLVLRVTPASGLTLRTPYGLPPDTVKDDGLTLAVPTVFLSKRRGGIALRLRSEAPLSGPVQFASARLDYRTPEGTPIDETLPLSGPGDGVGGTPAGNPPGLERIAALTNMYLAMRAASALAIGAADHDRVVTSLHEAIAQLERVAVSQGDKSFTGEADLLRKLESNLDNRP